MTSVSGSAVKTGCPLSTQGADAEPLARRGVERCQLVAITVLGEDRQRLALLLGDGAHDAVGAGIRPPDRSGERVPPDGGVSRVGDDCSW